MKYALVTGACGGMGQQTVSLLKQQGYFVFALDKKEAPAQDGVLSICVDLTAEKDLQHALREVRSVTDSIDVIVHLAGMYLLDSLVEISREMFTLAFEVNVFAAFSVNRCFLPLLSAGSKILLVTSELAPRNPLPFTGLYAITKGALDRYAYSLRMELQLLGISVSVLRAGAVKTDMLDVSTAALDRFCNQTALYSCNATRFQTIVNQVEARHISAKRLAKKICAVLQAKRPKFAYSINRNPLLLLLDILPSRLQFWVIRKILE